MQHTLLAKDFFFDPMLPIRLFHAVRSEGARWHSHEFTEIAIAISGEAVYETEYSSLAIQAGDVLIMPSGGSHFFHNESELELFNVLFQFNKLPIPDRDIAKHPGFSSIFRLNAQYCHENRFYPHFRLSPQDLERVKNLLQFACEDQDMQSSGYLLSVYGAFLQLIPILLNNYQRSLTEPLKLRSPERLAGIMDYMQNNFREELLMGDLAQAACMSIASFERHFRAATGLTPRDYLLQLRLEEAKGLLANTEMNISEISMESGFGDSNYFSRQFRVKTGVTPREYRKLRQKNQSVLR